MTSIQSFDTLFATAQQSLLTPYAIEARHIEQVFASMLAHRLDYADLYFQYSRAESWSLEEGIVKSGSFNIDQGVGVRAVSGEKTAFAYSDDISLPALQQAADATRAIAAQGGDHTAQAVRHITAPQLYVPHDPIASLRDEDKVKLLEKLEGYARALDPRITQVTASLAGEYEVVMIARHDGMMAADIRPLVRISIQVIAEQDGRREQGGSGGGGRFDYAYFTDEVLQDYARKAVHQAVTNLNARPAPHR